MTNKTEKVIENFSNQSTPIQNMVLAHKALTGLLKITKELLPGLPGLAIQDHEALNNAPITARETAFKIESDLAIIGIVICKECKEFISFYQIPDCPHCHTTILKSMEEDGFEIDWEKRIVKSA